MNVHRPATLLPERQPCVQILPTGATSRSIRSSGPAVHEMGSGDQGAGAPRTSSSASQRRGPRRTGGAPQLADGNMRRRKTRAILKVASCTPCSAGGFSRNLPATTVFFSHTKSASYSAKQYFPLTRNQPASQPASQPNKAQIPVAFRSAPRPLLGKEKYSRPVSSPTF